MPRSSPDAPAGLQTPCLTCQATQGKFRRDLGPWPFFDGLIPLLTYADGCLITRTLEFQQCLCPPCDPDNAGGGCGSTVEKASRRVIRQAGVWNATPPPCKRRLLWGTPQCLTTRAVGLGGAGSEGCNRRGL